MEKKIAVVTGASRGIGSAIAKRLAADGAFVVINYNGSEARALAVKEEIEAAGGEACIMQWNVASFEACEAAVKQILKEYGRIDCLVNNAGITRDGLMMAMKEADFDDVINTNLKGTFNMIRFTSRQMMKQRSGRIVNLSSVVGVRGNAGQLNYSASKAGVIGITKSAAKELASRGVTVNAIAPGYVQTEMTDVLKDDVKNAIRTSIPMGSFGKPEDIANAVSFFCSDGAAYITGQVLCVDGGMAV